jgi:hypothetical protein
LLTISIRVNVLFLAESIVVNRGRVMKKTQPTRGIWDWLLGGGWCGGGSNG